MTGIYSPTMLPLRQTLWEKMAQASQSPSWLGPTGAGGGAVDMGRSSDVAPSPTISPETGSYDASTAGASPFPQADGIRASTAPQPQGPSLRQRLVAGLEGASAAWAQGDPMHSSSPGVTNFFKGVGEAFGTTQQLQRQQQEREIQRQLIAAEVGRYQAMAGKDYAQAAIAPTTAALNTARTGQAGAQTALDVTRTGSGGPGSAMVSNPVPVAHPESSTGFAYAQKDANGRWQFARSNGGQLLEAAPPASTLPVQHVLPATETHPAQVVVTDRRGNIMATHDAGAAKPASSVERKAAASAAALDGPLTTMETIENDPKRSKAVDEVNNAIAAGHIKVIGNALTLERGEVLSDDANNYLAAVNQGRVFMMGALRNSRSQTVLDLELQSMLPGKGVKGEALRTVQQNRRANQATARAEAGPAAGTSQTPGTPNPADFLTGTNALPPVGHEEAP